MGSRRTAGPPFFLSPDPYREGGGRLADGIFRAPSGERSRERSLPVDAAAHGCSAPTVSGGLNRLSQKGARGVTRVVVAHGSTDARSVVRTHAFGTLRTRTTEADSHE